MRAYHSSHHNLKNFVSWTEWWLMEKKEKCSKWSHGRVNVATEYQGNESKTTEGFNTSPSWNRVDLFFLILFPSSYQLGDGKRTMLEKKKKKKKEKVWDWNWCWRMGGDQDSFLISRPAWMPFSCFRQTIFCKLNVTSVTFGVYYMNFEMQWDGRGSWSLCFYYACVFLYVSMNVRLCRWWLEGWNREMRGGKHGQIYMHFEAFTPANASSVFSSFYPYSWPRELNVL